MSQQATRVVFVCLGNICRSPLAEGAFAAHVKARGLSERFDVDSAGTSGYHVGELPDPRSMAVAARHDVDISHQRSRQFLARDLQDFDYVIAMDRSNRRNMLALDRPNGNGAVTLLMDEVPGAVKEVPDPYYGGPQGFDTVWRMVDEATEALLNRILSEQP